VTELADACQELAGWLAIAETLAAIPDIQPSARPSGRPGTRMPGNVAVLHAIMDAHAGIRDLEADFRMRVTGVMRERGGSDGNTTVALEALPNLAGAVDVHHQRDEDEQGRRKPCRCVHCDALRQLGHWAMTIQRLPAVDTVPRWIPIRPGPDGLPPVCPWCKTFSLRLSVELGVICCVFPGCKDDDGNRPQAHLDISRVSGQPVLAWKSGLVQ
jgi:hypothetical protein